MRYAFCLEMLYTEFPFIDRLIAAKQDGIGFIEFWGWLDKDLNLLNQRRKELTMKISNMSGNRQYGMIDSQQRQFLLNEITETIKIAQDLNCPRLMLLVQSLRSDGKANPVPENLSKIQIIDQVIGCGNEIAALADTFDIDIVVEPLNSIIDHPGYFLNSSALAFQIIKEIDHPRIKILYDIYHMAVMGENILQDIEVNLDLIGYLHVADKPGRNEPGSGEIDYKSILSVLKSLNFCGMIGFECYASDRDSHKAVKNILNQVSMLI
jgi:hydroxypyruvate isomerase